MGNEQPSARNSNKNQDNDGKKNMDNMNSNKNNGKIEVESQCVWTCPTCTFENKIKHDICQMCFNGDRPHTLNDKILIKQLGLEKKNDEGDEVKRKVKDEDTAIFASLFLDM